MTQFTVSVDHNTLVLAPSVEEAMAQVADPSATTDTDGVLQQWGDFVVLVTTTQWGPVSVVLCDEHNLPEQFDYEGHGQVTLPDGVLEVGTWNMMLGEPPATFVLSQGTYDVTVRRAHAPQEQISVLLREC